MGFGMDVKGIAAMMDKALHKQGRNATVSVSVSRVRLVKTASTSTALPLLPLPLPLPTSTSRGRRGWRASSVTRHHTTPN